MKKSAVLAAVLAATVAGLVLAGDTLVNRLTSHDPAVREKAIEDFQQLPPETRERFASDLMVAMNDDDAGVRMDAARLLRGMGLSSDKAGRDLRKELPKRGESSRVSAYREIQAAKKQDFPDLKSALDEEKKLPSTFGEDDAVRSKRTGMADALVAALDDPDPMVRAHSARELAQSPYIPHEALPKVTELLNDKNTEVRASAAAVLAAMGPFAKPAVPALMKLAGDPEPGVRAVAADALEQIQRRR